MKEYKLNFKYIRNKQSAALAVLNCIYDSVISSDSKLLPRNEDDCKQPFVEVVSMMQRIFEMERDPVETMSKEFTFASLKEANCFRRLDEFVEKINNLIDEPVVINFVGQMCDYSIMSMIPDFPEDKVKINIVEKQ